MPKVTIQTRSPKTGENQAAISYLKEFGVVFGSAIRCSFSASNKLGKTKDSSKTLRTSIAALIETRYGLSNSEAKNAALRGIAAYDAQSALVDTYIDDAQEEIKAVRASIGKNHRLLKKATQTNNQCEIRRLRRSNHYSSNRIAKSEAKLKRLKKSKEDGRFKVCFGSKPVSEEPDEGKLSSPVLQTSTGGDPCTEFSTPHIPRKTCANGSLWHLS